MVFGLAGCPTLAGGGDGVGVGRVDERAEHIRQLRFETKQLPGGVAEIVLATEQQFQMDAVKYTEDPNDPAKTKVICFYFRHHHFLPVLSMSPRFDIVANCYKVDLLDS